MLKITGLDGRKPGSSATWKLVSNMFELSEISAIIHGDGVHAHWNGLEMIDHNVANHFDCESINFAQQDQTRFQ